MKEDNMSYELEFTVLGLLGPAGSGKDLVADYLQKKNFVKIAFADPMKRFAKKAFNLSNEQLWGESYQRNGEFFVDEAWWMEVIGHFGPASQELINEVLEVGTRTEGYLKLHDWLSRLRMDYREKISPRVILQTLGTEWGRSVDPLMWIRYAYQCVDQVKKGHFYTQVGGVRMRNPGEVSAYAGAVIPDHRFRNEVESTKNNGGYVIRLRRLALEEKTIGVAGHKSEAEQKELPDSLFSLVLEFPEGVEKVQAIVEAAYAEKAWKLWSLQPTIRETDPS